MLVIEFKKGQGLGNQLWNYASLRSIARYKKFSYRVMSFDNFKGTDFIKIKERDTDEEINKIDLQLFKEKHYYDNDLKCFVYGYDKDIKNIEDDTKLEGVFQSEKYLFPNKKIINDFFDIDLKNYKQKVNFEKTCILNIRGGEYKMHRELILPKTYWLNAIKNIKERFGNLEFKIITDDNDYASRLFPNYEIIRGGIKSDFINLYFSKYLILSNSSFSYFPINLGTKPKYVLAPFNWARFNNKYKRWVSFSNFTEEWHWQNQEGVILNNDELIISVKESETFYNSLDVLTSSSHFKKFKLRDLLPKGFKNKIKKILGKIFPLLIG